MASSWSKLIGSIRVAVGGPKTFRAVYRTLPSGHRCKHCHTPFDGLFAIPFRLYQIGPSRKNPNLCTTWYELAPPGGEEAEISVLFVDVRGFTSLSEKTSPVELASLMNDFYRSSSDAVVKLDGTVDKFVGDQIMAFFGAPFRPEDHAERAVQAAVSIITNVSRMSNELEVGGGVATGDAFVGNVGGTDIPDFTVLGDVINVAARLQGHASPREVLLEKGTYEHVKRWYPDLDKLDLQLKGKAEATEAWILRTN